MKHKRSMLGIALATIMLVSLISVTGVVGAKSAATVSAPSLVGAPVQGRPVQIWSTDGSHRWKFCTGYDGALWFNKGGGAAWTSLGGFVTADEFSATSSGVNQVTVYVRGGDGTLWYQSQQGADWSGWTKWDGPSLAGNTGPAAYTWPGVRDGVFYVDAKTSALMHTWKDVAGTHSANLGGIVTASPGAAVPAGSTSRVDVFVRGTDGSLFERVGTMGGFNTWASLGGYIADGTGPTAVGGPGNGVAQDPAVVVAVKGSNGAAWIRISRDADGANWAPNYARWRTLDGNLNSGPYASIDNIPTPFYIYLTASNGAGQIWSDNSQLTYVPADWSGWSFIANGP